MLKTETVKVIGRRDWDSFVQKTYGKIYSFQQQDGCKERGIERITVPDEYDEWDYKNTKIPFEVSGEEMGVSFETWLSTSVEDTIKYFENQDCSAELLNKLFWQRNFYPDVNMIASDLCSKGLMEPGEYLIIIDW
jgi:hypothetical protein